MKIAMSAPHTPSRPGAKSKGINEYMLGSAVIGQTIFLLQKDGHEAWLIGAGSNKKQIEDINMLKCDCGLELHFNAFTDKSFKGSETLHAGSKMGVNLASCIQANMVEVLRTRDRGILPGHYRGDVRKPIIEILTGTNCPFVVPEPLFLSNPSDFRKIDIQSIAQALFNGLTEFSEIYNIK